MTRRGRWLGLAISGVGIAMQFASFATVEDEPEGAFFGLFILGMVVLAVGLALYSKSKGHSAAFCAAALASFLGLVLVAALGDRSVARKVPTPARRAGVSVAAYGTALLVFACVSAVIAGAAPGGSVLWPLLLLFLGAKTAQGSRAALAGAAVVTGLALCGGVLGLALILSGPRQLGGSVAAMRLLVAAVFLLSAWSALNLLWLWRAIRSPGEQTGGDTVPQKDSRSIPGPVLIGLGVLVLLLVCGFVWWRFGGGAGVGAPAGRKPPAAAWEAPDEGACIDFARRIEQNVVLYDGSLLEQSLDADALTQRAMAGMDLPPSVLAPMKVGFSKSMTAWRDLARQVKAGRRYTFLRVHNVEGEARALFRLSGGPNTVGGGLNYHDFVLISRNGEVRIADVYVFTTGEFLSDTLRRAALPLLAEREKSVLRNLAEGESDYVSSLPRVEAFIKAARAGQADAALRIYEGLPPVVRKQKHLAMARLAMLSQAGRDSELAEALAELERTFPDDPSLEFALIDQYVATGRYVRALAAVRAVEEAIGGDAYLALLRGRLHVDLKQYQDARAAFEAAIGIEPTLADAYWGLILVAAGQRKWGEVSRGLTRMEETLQVEVDPTADPQLHEYLGTEEYRQWREARGVR